MADVNEEQFRGDRSAYDRYLAGMDASMRQKVALTAAHLLAEGRIADMGMGSGAGSDALAALYPKLDVVGVDLSPQMVELASKKYQRANLSFVEGDIAAPVFASQSLDGVLNSSVLHHVTTFGDYDHDAASRALEEQTKALRFGGCLIVRDFVDPTSPPTAEKAVYLDLPDTDGTADDDPRSSSTAHLFERFAREFRVLAKDPGFSYEALKGEAPEGLPRLRKGWRRYALQQKHAAEFLLRKDYRRDWELEVKEEYTYYSQAEFEAVFARLGLRVLASTPIRNPWIVEHRFKNKYRWYDSEGSVIDHPATNYVIAGERVPPGEGVRFSETSATGNPSFLHVAHYVHVETGAIRDVVRRPNVTIDVLPWFEDSGDVMVVARKSYPRPILASLRRARPIDGSQAPHYVTEPLNVFRGDLPVGRAVEGLLGSGADISQTQIRGFMQGARYFPSPGGIEEEVQSVLVEVDATLVGDRVKNISGFSTGGTVRAIEARQLLRAAQVGGLPDARLELNVYGLLSKLGRGFGPWIGAKIDLEVGTTPQLRGLSDQPRRSFQSTSRPAEFLDVIVADFTELDASGAPLNRRVREYVVPKDLSTNTVAVAVLRKTDVGLFIGVFDDDLPAAQALDGNSNLLVTPAWRLPRSADGLRKAREFVKTRLEQQHGLVVGRAFELGGFYHPSAGVTPEVVHPLAVEIIDEVPCTEPLSWVRLDDLLGREAWLRDGHLRIVANRARHAVQAARAIED